MENQSFNQMKNAMDKYYSLSEETFLAIKSISRCNKRTAKSVLCKIGQFPAHIHFVSQGLVRAFVLDEMGNEYNKNFFDENKFPGSMTALLTGSPSHVGLETIEDSVIIDIDFVKFRQLLLDKDDLKMFQIHYLEHNWLIAKDARENEIVQSDASTRYKQFQEKFPDIAARLPLYQIASHLGITPTQLSRIRRNL